MANKRTGEPSTPQRSPEHFIVVSYDIPDNKRRAKVSKVLEDYGKRVQYSVFECHLRIKDYQRLQQRLRPLLVHEEDDVRFFHLCESCRRRAKVWSRKKRRAPEATVIV
ncbi:MAG: CRISPR-associated endonuclease Cas2 [Anaerolineae bacterium]